MATSSSHSTTSTSTNVWSRSLQELGKRWTVGRAGSKETEVEDGSGRGRVLLHLMDPTPSTPVGLKPRRSVSSLRSALGITGSSAQSGGNKEEDRTALAPTAIMASPVVSTSSFYASSLAGGGSSFRSSSSSTSSHHQQEVAASPVLLPGRARTAVGALVAATSAATADPTSLGRISIGLEGPVPQPWGAARDKASASSSPLREGAAATAAQDHSDSLNRSLQSILPPFDDVDNYRYSGGGAGRSRRYAGSEEPQREGRNPSPTTTNRPPPPPIMSPDVVETFRSPLFGGGVGGASPPPRRILHGPHHLDATHGRGSAKPPTLAAAALDPVSPVRRGGPRAASLSPSNSIVASPSSLADDFGEPLEFAAGRRDDQSISGSSTVGSLEDDDPHDHDSPDSFGSNDPRRSHDVTLQKHKFANQRQAHEDLIVAALERLQDETELVGEIQRQLGHDVACGNPPSSGDESFLAGLSTETARGISTTLTQILRELDVTEQLLFSSPTDMAAVSIPRNDFRDAIRFCLQLVRASTTTSTAGHRTATEGGTQDAPENNSRWRLLPGIKSSLGLIPESPQLPRRGGGDTSVFSVPCDDSVATPMTSNVSLSTTITTRTHLTAANLASPGHSHHPPPRFHHQALEIRHTISTVARLLDRLSRLLKKDKLPTQEIKRVYLEMQTLDVGSLKSVVEAFEIEPPDSLVMLLSGSSASQDDDLSDVPAPTAASTWPRPGAAQGLIPEPAAPRPVQLDPFFSPILRSQTCNRLEDGKEQAEGAAVAAAEAATTDKRGFMAPAPQGKARAGRRGGSRRGGGGHGLFRRSSLKLQDPLNL